MFGIVRENVCDCSGLLGKSGFFGKCSVLFGIFREMFGIVAGLFEIVQDPELSRKSLAIGSGEALFGEIPVQTGLNNLSICCDLVSEMLFSTDSSRL